MAKYDAASSNSSTPLRQLNDFGFLMDEHAIPLHDLVRFLQVNIDTGLDKLIYQQRLETEGENLISPPSKCPSWMFCLLPCLKNSEVMKNYYKLHPKDASVIRKGALLHIPSSSLVRGDIIEIRAGDKIPADARILKAKNSFKVDRGLVLPKHTSDIIECTIEPLEPTDAINSLNMAFMGCLCVSGEATAVVVRTGNQTLWAHLLKCQRDPQQMRRVSNRFKKKYKYHDHIV